MAKHDTTKADSKSLRTLMQVDADKTTEWVADDMAAMWRHQLRAPLQTDLGAADDQKRKTVTQIQQTTAGPLGTFGDLFQHPFPPLPLLRLAKDLAKTQQKDPQRMLPEEIATALYFVAIATARFRLGQRITALSNDALRKGLQWTQQRKWLDESSRLIIENALRLIQEPPPDPDKTALNG